MLRGWPSHLHPLSRLDWLASTGRRTRARLRVKRRSLLRNPAIPTRFRVCWIQPIGTALLRQLCVAHGVLDIFVPEIILDRSCVVTIACQLIAGGMAQHVSMDLKRKARFPSCAFDEPIKAISREWPTTFAHEYKR